jgi:hypothetical protein
MHSSQKLLLITAPFTQLNTPYPGTIYLKGYLNTLGISSYQCDLGIEVILDVFSKNGLEKIFAILDASEIEVSANTYRINSLKADYIQTIDAVILFLQNKNPTLAHSICDRTFLPEASRFNEIEDLDWAFGSMGLQDKARHIATLYLEDLGDMIKECIDPHFGFSRYAERLGRTASSFDELNASLQEPNTLIVDFLLNRLEDKIKKTNPTIICFSVPFPGNLFATLKCGQYIKENYPSIKIIFGGGFANTELRSISDTRVFDYIDFICLDDGERPLQCVIEHLDGTRELKNLKRTFTRVHNEVIYFNGAIDTDIAQKDTGTPDYSDLILEDYLSVIEVVNPMHRMWSDGRWNKLTLAHGCYWGRCTFCDISLDYIRKYEPLTAVLICDRMETIIVQTNQNGFHFVDEAAPPNLLREVALEILRRKLVVTWWTNIRFEKHFTPDLARLLKASGCIAVAGGLEVASDRLLKLMKKGVTVEQVDQVAEGLTNAGILVHAYLMYGFPTETAQETIDSLENVRQLFDNGVLHSGFWHQFAMTSHSPVGLHPEQYDVVKIGPKFEGFADNDLYHDDPSGADHELFSKGLSKSLFNFMHGIGLDYPLDFWFEFDTPKTTLPKKQIRKFLDARESKLKDTQLMVWLGNLPSFEIIEEQGKQYAQFEFCDKKKDWMLHCDVKIGEWLYTIFPLLLVNTISPYTIVLCKASYQSFTNNNFQEFMDSEIMSRLRENGLVIL